VLRDKYLDIEQVSGGYAVDVLTEIKLVAAMKDGVEEELMVDSGAAWVIDDFEALHQGTP
jgi:hypothetical protein